MLLQAAMRQKYEEFIREGSLHVMNGTVLDWEEIYEDVDAFVIASEYDVRCFGYDPYNAKEFVLAGKLRTDRSELRRSFRERRPNRFRLAS
jgi:phage terminase large subunit-like protein